MAKFRFQKNTLVAGEISPASLGRTDLPNYQHACKQLKNMIPMASGGAYKRAGTWFHGFRTSTNYISTIIPFVISKDRSYAIVVDKNGATPAFEYWKSTGYSSATGTSGGGTHPWLSSTTTGPDTRIDDEWHTVQWAQNANILTAVQENRAPHNFHFIEASLTITCYPFYADSAGTTFATTKYRDAWPYLTRNTNTAITFGYSATTVGTGRVVTAGAAFFSSKHVGAVFKTYDGAGQYGCFVVTGYTSSTQVTVTIIVDLFAAAAGRSDWWESAWSDYRGWPSSVGYYLGRRVYGGTTFQPDALWFSEEFDYDQLSHDSIVDPTSSPSGSQAFTLPLLSTSLNRIRWISPEKTLVVGTSGDEFVVEITDPTAAFGCKNVSATPNSHYGSAYVMPVRVGKELMFVRSPQDEITSLVFNEVEQAYVHEPVQAYFDHFPKLEGSIQSIKTARKRIRRMAWDSSRKVMWCVDTAGNLFSLSRDRQIGFTAWASHELGGYDATVVGTFATDTTVSDPAYGLPAGGVVSVCTTPNPDTGLDDVWLLVRRKISGTWYTLIERMTARDFTPDTAYLSGMYWYLPSPVDCAQVSLNKYPAAEDYKIPNTAMPGVAPKGVAISLNGYGMFSVVGDAVSAGNTTIQTPYPHLYASSSYNVVMGYLFDAVIIPVRPDAGSQIGSAQGAVKRIHEACVRFSKTLSAGVGADSSNIEELSFATGLETAGYSPDVFTGDKVVKVDSDYDRDGYLYIRDKEALPMKVVSIAMTGMTYD